MEAKTRVLVVEDSPDQARLIAGLLQSGGFSTEVAASGAEAGSAGGNATAEASGSNGDGPVDADFEVVEEDEKS